ncbi:SbcC/MukB-like Walker B domain-containing protein [Levilactobacillus yonginensis]|uniref:SbcC/MukB-like Walker B domain-containing protein n=1 Tax=Levilactobacillus yonginensis TaxID=1054041 RepID=UPI00345D2AE5
MKNAQEGIDPDMIGQVAESQRDVNQTNGMLQRIKRAQERLDKIKKDVFWRNLNHIRENILDPYSQVTQDSEAKKEQIDQAQQVIGTVEEQLQLITDNLKASTQNLESLRQEKANQEGLIQRRKDYQQQINSLTQRLATYRSQLKQLQGLKDELTKITRSQADCQQQSQEIREHSIQPLLTELAAAAKDRPELTTVVTEVENAKLNQDLGDYLRQMKSAVTKYQNDERAKERVGQDIKIVSDMRTTLDTRIDKRAAGPLQGRVRHDLHQDNLEVHEAGAAKMSTQFEQLLLKQQELLAKHPDLKGILSLPDFILHLTKLRESLTENLRQLERLDQQVKQLLTQQNFCERQIAAVDIEQNFDEQRVTSDIDKLQERHDQLVVDTEIDVKIEQAEKDYQKFLTEQQNLGAKRAKAEERIANSQSEIKRFAEKLAQLDAAGLQVLQLLAPYHPENVQLDTVIAAIDFVQNNRSQVRNSSYGETGDRLARLIHDNGSNGIDRNALDTIFEERGYSDIASAMRQHRTINRNDVIMVNFDINRAQLLMATDENHVAKKLTELQLGNNVALDTYLTAAVQRITAQYKLITDYNRMLLEGVSREQSIKLKIELTPSEVADEVIDEACNPKLTDRPVLTAEIQNRLEKLATDLSIADDEELFMAAAQKLLDTRQWSAFKVLIKRRQSAEDNYEEVDDKFVQSGGSGAEKAQAMVLPLLLVPKMVLRQATLQDAPYLVMFDEFADKLDPETAKSFAKTISRFGFNFIATMPSGAQNKILADRVDNIAYDVIAPRNQNDGRFHENIINEALTWGDAHE